MAATAVVLVLLALYGLIMDPAATATTPSIERYLAMSHLVAGSSSSGSEDDAGADADASSFEESTGAENDHPRLRTPASGDGGGGRGGEASGNSSSEAAAQLPSFYGEKNRRARSLSPPSPPKKVIDPETNTILEPPYGAMTLRLIVLTCDRGPSLRRLLRSLLEAEYFNETANLDIWIDMPPPPDPDAKVSLAGLAKQQKGKKNKNLNFGVSVGGKKGSSIAKIRPVAPPKHDPDVVEAAESFAWPHGKKTVHLREENVGLARQWHETWNASLSLSTGEGLTRATSEKVLLLEDDMEVSPHFWRWLRWCHHAYGNRPDFAACTLKRLRLCAARCGEDLNGGPADATPNFMYPLEGSWGFSPSASHWINFTSWAADFTASGENRPLVPGLTPSKWYEGLEKMGRCPGRRCIWTQHHIRYADEHQDRYTVYARGGGKAGSNSTLGANWLERGMHFRGGRNRTDFPRVVTWDDDTLGRFGAEPTRLNWSAERTGGGRGKETSWTKEQERLGVKEPRI